MNEAQTLDAQNAPSVTENVAVEKQRRFAGTEGSETKFLAEMESETTKNRRAMAMASGCAHRALVAQEANKNFDNMLCARDSRCESEGRRLSIGFLRPKNML